MRELPPSVDADAVLKSVRYLDEHAKTTPVSISEALRVVRPLAPSTRPGDTWLEELMQGEM